MTDPDNILENKEYKWFVVNITTNKVVGGFEYEDDAHESWRDMPNDGQYKVYSRRWLNRLYNVVA